MEVIELFRKEKEQQILEEQRMKEIELERIKLETKYKKNKDKGLPIEIESSEEESDDELMGLDSDGEIPDYSQEQLEFAALKNLAKNHQKKKRVVLRSNTHSKEESLIVKKLSSIHDYMKEIKANRLAEMRVLRLQ
eukprot:GHVR01191643.1.p1 GENE.GHVR01191643.1~~GHVR01191643.1.p1  ORF type:complete len:136 (-),score=25.14 GHVR01191643.1:305-712(-)